MQKKRVSYTFPNKEAKFSKLKYFLIIIIKRFFSFYDIFFYTQPVDFLHLLRDFCNVHDHIADNRFLHIFIYMKKKIIKKKNYKKI